MVAAGCARRGERRAGQPGRGAGPAEPGHDRAVVIGGGREAFVAILDTPRGSRRLNILCFRVRMFECLSAWSLVILFRKVTEEIDLGAAIDLGVPMTKTEVKSALYVANTQVRRTFKHSKIQRYTHHPQPLKACRCCRGFLSLRLVAASCRVGRSKFQTFNTKRVGAAAIGPAGPGRALCAARPGAHGRAWDHGAESWPSTLAHTGAARILTCHSPGRGQPGPPSATQPLLRADSRDLRSGLAGPALGIIRTTEASTMASTPFSTRKISE